MYHNGHRIAAEKLIQAVREIAAERPDFVYPAQSRSDGPTCYYTTEDGSPDCIIGHAMARIGQALPAQRRRDWNECHLLNYSVREGGWPYVLNTTQENLLWLGWVQHYQDSGYTWAAAVESADSRLEGWE
jgi:hypothetical protein